MELQTQIILLVVLLGLSGFFSMSETALISLSKMRVRSLAEKKKAGLLIKKMRENPHRLLSTILIGNNLVNTAASAMATAMAIDVFESKSVGVVIGVMTFLILFFGEIIPKSLAIVYAEPLALVLVRPVYFFSLLFFPFAKFFDVFMNLITRNARQQPSVTEEELKSLVNIGKEEGSIKASEKELIQNIFRFDDVDVKEIMTPRPDMKCIKHGSLIGDVLDTVIKTPFSRFPVFERSRDHIKGIVYVKDILRYVRQNKLKATVDELMRPVHFVPETKKIDSLLRHFQKRKEQMAIVVNEHGVVVGLVTLENVLEEIVGDIVDETEKIVPAIEKTGSRRWRVMGKADLTQVNKKLGAAFRESEDYETFGGYIFRHLGHIPKEGQTLELEGFTIKITSMDKNRIIEAEIVRKR